MNKLNRMWLGTALYNGSFGKPFIQREINQLIDFASELGIDKIDTAECYGVEEIIGKAINKRRKFTIATKFGHQLDENNELVNRFDLAAVIKQLETSLKLLSVDRIDVYYFHSGTNLEFDNDELWSYLNKAREKGMIGKLGLSLQHALVVNKDYFQIRKTKEYGIDVVQTVLNKYSRASLDYVIPYCQRNHILVIGRMPLAKGLLSGKYQTRHVFDKNDERSRSPDLNDKIIADNPQSDVRSALTWARARVDELVIGSKNKKQLLENYHAINA